MPDPRVVAQVAEMFDSAVRHGHTELGGQALLPETDLQLRNLATRTASLGAEPLVPLLQARADSRDAQVRGDLAVQGQLRAARAPEVRGGVFRHRDPAASAPRVFTLAAAGAPVRDSFTYPLCFGTLKLPVLGPGRWMVLLAGGLGWPDDYDPSSSNPEAQLCVRLVIYDAQGEVTRNELVPLVTSRMGAAALEVHKNPYDFEAWYKARAGESFAGATTQQSMGFGSRSPAYIDPTRWPGSLSLSCVYPAPQEPSGLELRLKSSGRVSFWGRCLLQAVFLPRGGTA